MSGKTKEKKPVVGKPSKTFKDGAVVFHIGIDENALPFIRQGVIKSAIKGCAQHGVVEEDRRRVWWVKMEVDVRGSSPVMDISQDELHLTREEAVFSLITQCAERCRRLANVIEEHAGKLVRPRDELTGQSK